MKRTLNFITFNLGFSVALSYPKIIEWAAYNWAIPCVPGDFCFTTPIPTGSFVLGAAAACYCYSARYFPVAMMLINTACSTGLWLNSSMDMSHAVGYACLSIELSILAIVYYLQRFKGVRCLWLPAALSTIYVICFGLFLLIRLGSGISAAMNYLYLVAGCAITLILLYFIERGDSTLARRDAIVDRLRTKYFGAQK